MSADPSPDLNAVIVNAVNARVEAEVLKALSGDATIGQFVAAALTEMVPKNPNDRYDAKKETYVANVLRKAIKEATKTAVEAVILEQLPTIEAEVRKALRRDIAGISEALAQSLASTARNAYGVKVDLTLRMPGDGG